MNIENANDLINNSKEAVKKRLEDSKVRSDSRKKLIQDIQIQVDNYQLRCQSKTNKISDKPQRIRDETYYEKEIESEKRKQKYLLSKAANLKIDL